VFPSASVSLVKTLPEIGVSSVALTASSVATGPSFTDLTRIVSVAVSVELPSEIV
jgi:hypothetical protein